jgi:hypothetical protein
MNSRRLISLSALVFSLSLVATACGPSETASPYNPCGGLDSLRYADQEAGPGEPCGVDGTGQLVCDGQDALRCDDGTSGYSLVVTLGPEDITSRSVQLRGSITALPDAGVSDHGFCWSVDSGAASPQCHSLGPATEAGNFSYRISDLDPGRRYYGRAYAVVGETRTQANEVTWLTMAPATQFTASEGTFNDRVVVTWTAVEGAIGYAIIRDQQELAVVEVEASTYEDSTASEPPVPSAPLQFIASEGDYQDEVRLSWQESQDAVARHAYRVDVIYPDLRSDSQREVWGYRTPATITGYELEIDGTPADIGLVTGYADAQAGPGALVAALIHASEGQFTDRIVADVVEPARHAPTLVSYRLRAMATNGPGTWTAAVEGYRGASPIGYQWERSGADADADYQAVAGAEQAMFVDEDAPSDGSGRHYRLVARADGFEEVVSESARGYVARMPAPTLVTCATGRDRAFTLGFNASEGNVDPSGYRVYGASTLEELATNPVAVVDVAPQASSVVLAPELDGPVFYGVRPIAVVEGGREIEGELSEGAGCVPVEPTGFSGQPADEGALLSWNADALPQVTAYEVHYRQQGSSSEMAAVLASCTAGQRCSLEIGSLEPLTTYQFYLIAQNAAGPSAPSPLQAEAFVEVYIPAASAFAANSSIEGDDGVADGTTASAVRIVLADRQGQPVVGVTPTFSASGHGNLYGACSATDASGLSTCTLRSTVGEEKTLRITSPIAVDGGLVRFTQGCDPAGIPFGGGRGTEAQPYTLCSAAQLNRVSAQGLTGHFVMHRDIDLADLGAEPFAIIGRSVRFSGSFDGAGHRISNLVIDEADHTGCGLFGFLSGTVKDLSLENVDVTCSGSVGGLAGVTLDAHIDGIHVSGFVSATGDLVGGLVGIASEGLIENITADVLVVGARNVGGLLGEMYEQARIENATVEGIVEGTSTVGGLVGLMRQDAVVQTAWVTVDVTGSSLAIGGFVGSLTANSIIRDASASGAVTGEVGVGGFAGRVLQGTIHRAVAHGSVSSTGTSGNSDTGGFVGFATGGLIEDSYASGRVTGHRRAGGFIGTLDASLNRTYASGRVTGSVTPGGLIGIAFQNSSVQSSYWNVETTELATSDGGAGLTTAEMGQTTSFSGWVFAPILDYVWWMPVGGPPMLWFEE